MLKVGDTIYRFDINRRVYARSGPNRGQAIFREHFEPHQITGETKQSWLVDSYGGAKARVNKKTMHQAGQNGWHGWQWYTEQGRKDSIWLNEHKYKIVQAVDRATLEQLKKIAELIGYQA